MHTAVYRAPISELQSVTCHMGPDSVTCHLTQVNAPHVNPSHTGQHLIYLPRRDRRLSGALKMTDMEMQDMKTCLIKYAIT